jgi:hypothetical protein
LDSASKLVGFLALEGRSSKGAFCRRLGYGSSFAPSIFFPKA